MSWYELAKKIGLKRYALRKTDIRSDIHVVAPTRAGMPDIWQLQSMMLGFCLAATARGLDVIGIVSDWLVPGKIARQICNDKNIDLKILPGQELVSIEGLGVLALNIENEIQQRIPWKEILQQIHAQNGISIIIQPGRRWVQMLNNVAGEPWAPDGIECYNSHYSREYIDLDADFRYEFFMSSGASDPNSLQDSLINTKTHRSWWENKGILIPGEGEDFEPGYLQNY